MFIRKLLIAITLLLLAGSCKKYGNGYVEGTVYETGTNAPMPGVQMYYGKWKKKPVSGEAEFERLGTTVTDSNGHYRFNLKKERTFRYGIFCQDSLHSRMQAGGEMNFKKTRQDFYLAPFAYIKIRIKKSSAVYKHIDITLNDNKLRRVRSTGPLDTILPAAYKLLGNSTNFIYWYITEVPPPPAYEISSYSEERDVYVAKGDTITRTFVID
jgi:hypothetical protein